MHKNLVAIVCCLVLSTSAPVLAAAPQLNQLSPQGGQRGTEVTVTLAGARLGQDPKEILWHEPGIEVRSIEPAEDNNAKATLFIPDECQPGRYAMRLRTATGISNVATFHVGTLPEVDEAEPNDSLEQPQSIEFGSVVNGLVKSEDVDYFSFDAKQGDPIAVEVDGLRLGRTFFDPVITLFDAEGNEIAKCDDWHLMRQDACFTHVAPRDGTYVLEIRESAYRGDNASTYRLHVGSFPRPLAVYPPGGRVGETIDVRWIGAADAAATQQVTLPAEPTAAFDYVPTNDRGAAPSPHPLRVIDAPVTHEVEPNNHRVKEPTAGEAPGAFCGVLADDGDQDHFRFSAKKGQVLHFRLHARSLGSPMDGVLRIYEAEGKNLSGNDDDRGYPDSYIRFQAPADGEYVAQVEDRLKRGGDAFVYWLEAKAADPAVELEFEEQRRYQAKLFAVPRGGRNGGVLRATRRDVGGELMLDWQNLPAGVSVEVFPLAGNFNRIPVLFSAAADAPLGQGLATMTAQRTEDDTPVDAEFTQVNWLVRGRNNRDMWNYTGTRAVVVVTEEAPYSIRIEDPKAPIVQRGTKNLRIVAERKDGFDKAILVRMLYNPPGVSSNTAQRIKEGETETLIPVTANDKATTGDWNILVRGEANAGGQLVTVTPFTTLTVASPYLAMELPKAKVEQGNSVSFPISIEHNTPFDGEAKIELVGLPPGVKTNPQTITSETEQIEFQLDVAGDARPGQHRGLFCRVTIEVNGEPVVHSVGSGELRVDTPLPPSPNAQASR